MKGTIKEIAEPYSTRTSKAGKNYQAQKVLVDLENGEQTPMLVFEELGVGQVIEVEKKGEYWNMASKKKADNDDVSKMLQMIYDQGSEIIRLIKSHHTGPLTDIDSHDDQFAGLEPPEDI